MDAFKQLLIEHFQEKITLSENQIQHILSSVKVKTLKKKSVLLGHHAISTHMNFIAKGCLRAYTVTNDAKIQITQFGIEGWWINDLYSYLTQTPSAQTIEALEDSVIIQIHKSTLNQWFDEIHPIERFFRLKFESAYVASQERTHNTINKTAEERYLEFRQKYRNIEQRVPQYMVASYLGITPEFLSMLRKRQTN